MGIAIVSFYLFATGTMATSCRTAYITGEPGKTIEIAEFSDWRYRIEQGNILHCRSGLSDEEIMVEGKHHIGPLS